MADLPNVNVDEIGVFKSIAGSAEDKPILKRSSAYSSMPLALTVA